MINDSSLSSSSAAGAASVTSSSSIFVPPPLPAFLTLPIRPGFQTVPTIHPLTPNSPTSGPPPPCRPKFRRFAWSKIPSSRVHGRTNVWTTSDRLFRDCKLDFERIEELFTVNVASSTSPAAPSSPSSSTGVKYPTSLSGAAGVPEPSARPTSGTSKGRSQSSEINLLDSRRSLNVNVFLRQFRLKSHSELVQVLVRGDGDLLGAEKLKCLQRVLPLDHERQLLGAFAGDLNCLGNAEKFCLAVMKLSNVEGRVEVMLFKEEFKQSIDRLNCAIVSVISTAQQLKTNSSLHQMLYMLLQAANFLHTGGYTGDAAGFRLNSLLNLAELRSNKPRMTLLHYVALEAEEKNADLLKFPDHLASLKETVECPVETLRSEISSLKQQLLSASKRLASIDAIFRNKFALFIQEAERGLNKLESGMKQVETLRLELAAFYCDDESTFQLDEAFKVIRTFCDKLQKAIKENRERRLQELRSEERRRLHEERLQKLGEERARRGSLSGGAAGDSDHDLEEALLSGAHYGRSARPSRGRLARSHSVCDTSIPRTTQVVPDLDDTQSVKSESDPRSGLLPQSGVRRSSGVRRLSTSFDDGCSGRERITLTQKLPSTFSEDPVQGKDGPQHNTKKLPDTSTGRNLLRQRRLQSPSLPAINGGLSSSGSDQMRSNTLKTDERQQNSGLRRTQTTSKNQVRKTAESSSFVANAKRHVNAGSPKSAGVGTTKTRPPRTSLLVRRTSLDLKSHDSDKLSSTRQPGQRLGHPGQQDVKTGFQSPTVTRSANSSPRLTRNKLPPGSNNAARVIQQRDASARLSQPRSTPSLSRRSSQSSINGGDDVDKIDTTLVASKLSCQLARIHSTANSINGAGVTSNRTYDRKQTMGQSLGDGQSKKIPPNHIRKMAKQKNGESGKVEELSENSKFAGIRTLSVRLKQTASKQISMDCQNNEITIAHHCPTVSGNP